MSEAGDRMRAEIEADRAIKRPHQNDHEQSNYGEQDVSHEIRHEVEPAATQGLGSGMAGQAADAISRRNQANEDAAREALKYIR